MNSNTINENIVTAMDILITKRLEQLKYNVTKICTIIDNVYKSLGKYTVQEEVIQYDAYSENTNLNIGDSVLVMIPNGDYNEQKIILNKVATDSDLTTSVAYTSPLKSMLSFTDNIIEKDLIQPDSESGVRNKKYFSLLANGDNKNGLLNPEVETSKLLYTIPWTAYNNYDRIGISADFQTWLKDLGTISGDYGLELLFFNSKASIIDQEKKLSTYRFTFGLNDILGDPYNFPSYFTQEKVIDISQLKDIAFLQIYFYQKGNFKAEDDTYILNNYEGDKLPDNIFVGDIKVYVGYDINKYSSDAITLNTSESLTYSKKRETNIKPLTLHWVHKIDEYNYEIIDGTNLINNKDIEVYWVRAHPNSDPAISDIVGFNWMYIDSELKVDIENLFKCDLFIESSENNRLAYEDTVKVKAVCRIKDGNNWLQYESNTLTFVTEDAAFDATTYNAVMGLSIVCLDGGYNGNYFIYGDDNKIIDESQGSGYYRKFALYYDGAMLERESKINGVEIDKIDWEIPINMINSFSTTMLSYPTIEVNNDNIENGRMIHSTQDTSLQYCISDIWYPSIASNTIECRIRLKNSDVYRASKELLFGKTGSQGSNYNLVIGYEDPSQNAFEIITDDNNMIDSSNSIKIIGKVFSTSRPIDNPEGTWKWNLYDGMPIQQGSNSGENTSSIFEFTTNALNTNIIEIRLKKDINQLTTNYTIIEAIFTPDDKDTEIVAYKPIAIKTINKSNGEPRCSTMAGAQVINYISSGPPGYSSESYKLYNKQGQLINDITWSQNPTTSGTGYPQLKNSGNGEVALSAAPFYINNINYQYSVVAKKGSTIYWIQPIQIIRSQYELGIINDWDGEAKIEEDSIVAATVAVGKKDGNVFSGIVLGQMADEDNNRITGLYGISKGINTFSLTENGLATFGKNIKNNENTIISSINIQLGENNSLLAHSNPVLDPVTGAEIGCSNHLLLDLDERIFELQADTTKKRGLFLNANGAPYFRIVSSNGNSLLTFTNEDFVLKSDGASSEQGLTFNVEKGIMRLRTGSYLALNSTDDHFGQKSADGNLMQVGKLKINKDGEVYYNNQTLTAYIKALIKEATE